MTGVQTCALPISTQANTKVDAIEFTLTQNGKSMTVKGFRKTGWEGEDY